ncbi:MAG: hypothetical protein GEU90_15575 [Gemmatimonas sp.]|nr:hypothetical protein [Gemmatimonas sp.]
MRKRYHLIAALLVVATGCRSTSDPVRQDIVGSWFSDDVPGTEIRMTLGESMTVTGAGAWIEAGESFAFAVVGALAGDEVSLYLDFAERPDLSIQGVFMNENTIVGALNGGMHFEESITLERGDLSE